MKLSIIIPVYNSEKFLDKCLASIINQTYKNLEIIIINDGSTDNSKKIIDKYLKKYKKYIKYIEQENSGQAHARNVGLKSASGDLITFVDSDDYILPTMYEDMINILKEKDVDMVMCDVSLEKEGKKTVYSATTFDNIYSCPVSLWNKIFKRKILNNISFIEKIWYEDYNYFMNICLKNPTYALCKKPLYVYVTHVGSTMNNNNSLKNLDIIIATEDIIKKGISKQIEETLIINHILIDTINRVYNQKSAEKKLVIKTLNEYIHKHIKSIFKTKEFKNTNIKRKIIMLLNYYGLGYLSHIILKIKRSVNI